MPIGEIVGAFLLGLLGGATAGVVMILVVGVLVKRYASNFMGGMMGGLGEGLNPEEPAGGFKVVEDDPIPDAPSSAEGEGDLDGVSEWETMVEDDG